MGQILTDIVLEVIRASIVLGIFMFVLVVGRGRFKLAHHGWRLIVGGFGLLLFGSVLDITDNFDSLNRFVVIGDTEVQAFLEKFVGYLGGYALLAIGLLRWIPTIEDLSERKRVEEALRGREAQMRLVTDALPALIACFDTEQRLQFVNKTFESWYEAPRDEIVGRKIRDVMAEYIAEADYERFRPHVETALTGEDVSFEEFVTYPDGKTRYVWVTYVPEFGSGGSIEGAFAFIQDITERKRMEDAVRESEARLGAIIDNAPNAISLKDRRGHYLLINRVFEDMLDTTSEAVRGKTSSDIFPREFAESGVAHDRGVVEKGRAIEREEELVLGDHVYTYLTTKFPIRDASGDIVSIGAIHTDITERKRSEDALRESEARLRDATHLANLGQFVWDDVAEKCIYCDEEYARIYGVSVAEYLSTYATYESDLDWVHAEDRERYRDVVFTEASKHRGAIDIEYRIIRRDGETRYIHERGTPVLDGDGALIRTIGTIQDITERKRTEERMREIEARYRTLANLSPVGIFHTDAQGLVTYVNERWCEIGGMTTEQAMGTGWIASVHPEDRERIDAEWDEAVKNERMYSLEYRYMHREGLVTWCYVQAVAETDADGNLAGHVGCVTDITERKRAEEALRQAHDELELRVEERTSELRAVNAQLLEEVTERKQAEATLKESEKKLHEILENSPVGVAVVSHAKDDARVTGKRLFINSALVQMFGGASGEDLIEAEISDSWVYLDHLQAIEEIMTSRDELVDFEAERRRLDGTEWWVSMNSRPIQFEGQDCTMVWHFDITERKRAEEALRRARDDLELRVEERTADLRTTNRVLLDEIAERKRAEQALQESEARYRAIFEQSPIGIWVDDWSMVKKMIDGLARRGVKDWRGYFHRRPEQLAKAYDLGHPTEISQAILEIYRAPTKQAVIDATVRETATPEMLEGFLAGLIAFIEGKTSHTHEATDIANDGSKILVRNAAVISPEHRDSWSRVLYSIEDITEERLAQQERQTAEARLRDAIGIMNDGLAVYDSEGRLVHCNDRFRDIHDYSEADTEPGVATYDSLGQVDAAHGTLGRQPLSFAQRLAKLRRAGSTETIENIGDRILERRQSATPEGGIISVNTDVIERRQTEDRVRRREAELAQVLRASTLGEMGATLAHEVNQPLTTVISISDVCLRKLRSQTCRPEELESMLEHVCEQGERAAKIIRRIGRFVRRSTPDISPTHVDDMVSEAVELLKSELRRNNVELRLELKRGLPAVSVDRIEIEQVLLNLLKNGSDALSEVLTGKRELAIQTSMSGEDMVEVSVSDTGSGLADDAVQNAFEPFFTTKPNGTGMGLSISRTIIEAHGGRLWWSNRDGCGTIFSFTLPIDRRAPRHGV